jgi:hypothetical protein
VEQVLLDRLAVLEILEILVTRVKLVPQALPMGLPDLLDQQVKKDPLGLWVRLVLLLDKQEKQVLKVFLDLLERLLVQPERREQILLLRVQQAPQEPKVSV